MFPKNSFLTSFTSLMGRIFIALLTFSFHPYTFAEQYVGDTALTHSRPISDERPGSDKRITADAPVDAGRVKIWIASQEAFARWGNQHDKALSNLNANPERESVSDENQDSAQFNDNPLAISAEQMLRPLKQAKLYDSAEKMIQASGFATLKDWADYTLRITQSAMAVQIEASGSIGNNAELERLLGEGQLSERDRAMLEAGIAQNQAIERFLKEQVSNSDKAAITPLLPMLEQFIEGF